LNSFFLTSGGKDGGDDEPDKMAIAFDRIARFKAWIKNGIIGFFRGIKNRLLRLIRGGGGRGDDIQLEVTEENDFQVCKTGRLRAVLLKQCSFTNASEAVLKKECFRSSDFKSVV